MRHPNEKHPKSAQVKAVIGFALIWITWLYFDFLVLGPQSYLAFVFVLSLYYFRQGLIAVLFRLAVPLVLNLTEADFMAWKLSILVPLVLYLLFSQLGVLQALPSLKKKPMRKRYMH